MTLSAGRPRSALSGKGFDAALMALVLPSLAPAQEVIRSHVDVWVGELGRGPFASLGDIDGDGVVDLVLGEPVLEVNSIQGAGRVAVISGWTGEVLFDFRGESQNGRLGIFVAGLGDLSGDGLPDFAATTAQPSQRTLFWSGADGALFAQVDLPFDAADTLGDLDDDGIPDFVSAFGYFGATVFHGGGFNARYFLDPPPATHDYGSSVATLGDVNGDGHLDFAVSAPGFSGKSFCVVGEVFVYSGENGALLWSVADDALDSLFGNHVAAPGDVDGDGIGDLAVAARAWGGPQCVFSGPGRVRFFSGRGGAELGVFDALPGWSFVGQELVAIGDLDGNGYGDVLVGLRAERDGVGISHIVAVDGGTRSPIYFMENPYGVACPGYGVFLSPAGDVNGDDFPDFFARAICTTIAPPNNRLDLVSGAPRGVRSLGEPCGSPTWLPRIGVSGVPRRGTQLPIHLSQVEPGQEAFLLAGQRLGPIPGSEDCLLVAQPFLVKRVQAGQVRPGEGVATAEIPVPSDASLAGAIFFVQWANANPAGAWRTTRVLQIQLQEEFLRRP